MIGYGVAFPGIGRVVQYLAGRVDEGEAQVGIAILVVGNNLFEGPAFFDGVDDLCVEQLQLYVEVLDLELLFPVRTGKVRSRS